MKKILLIILSIISFNIFAQNPNKDSYYIDISSSDENSQSEKKKLLNGYDGGMMLHAGYVKTYIKPIDYTAKGITKGIGGAIKFHLGKHYRIGTEGYVSTLKLSDNGSYIKTFWTGLINDFYWQFGKFMPYAGITIGGGALTDCIVFEGDNHDWEKENHVVINKTPFFAIDPIIGCDYCLSDAVHLTFKMDFLMGLGREDLYFPKGPRLYIGFIFFH